MRISCINSKGGVAKSTTAVYLAHAFAEDARTLLVDTDPQGSALAWVEAAGDVPFSVAGLPVASVDRRLGDLARDYRHVVIDTPPGHARIVRGVILSSDVVIVPLSPSLLDFDRIRPTLELLGELQHLTSVRVFCLLTRVRRGTRSAVAAREVIRELGLEALDAEVPLLERYMHAFGEPIFDLGDYKDVYEEVMNRVHDDRQVPAGRA